MFNRGKRGIVLGIFVGSLLLAGGWVLLAGGWVLAQPGPPPFGPDVDRPGRPPEHPGPPGGFSRWLGFLGRGHAGPPGPPGPGHFDPAAWDHPGPWDRYLLGNYGRWLVLKSELDLSQEQHEKLHEIVRRHRPEMPKIATELSLKVRALRDATLADGGDETAIRKAADELGKALGTAAIAASQGVGEAKQVLTDEQKASIKKFIAEHDKAQDKLFEDMKNFKPSGHRDERPRREGSGDDAGRGESRRGQRPDPDRPQPAEKNDTGGKDDK